VTRRRGFWPGQSGHSVPPGFLGDDDHDDHHQHGAGPAGPAVRWRTVDRPLYPDDVAHGRTDAHPDDVYIDEAYSADAYDTDAYREDGYGTDGYRADAYRSDSYSADAYQSDVYGADGADGADGPDLADVVEAVEGFDRYDRYGRFDDVYRFDDLADEPLVSTPDDPGPPAGYDGRDPTRPFDRPRTDDPGSVLRAMLVDRDDDRAAGEPRPRARRRWRLALAERLAASWPGQSEEGAPPGFPASGEVVLDPRPSAGATLVRLPVRDRPIDDVAAVAAEPEVVEAVEPDDIADADDDFDDDGPSGIDGPSGNGDPDDLYDVDELDDDIAVELPTRTPLRRSRRVRGRRRARAEGRERTGGVPGLPSLQRVAMAVYAALADPIVNADPEARERRTQQVRRFGMLAGSAALAVVLVYAIFPVRTYLEQRAASQRSIERNAKLREANAELERVQEELQDPETIIEIARRDYQMVFPGEESYGLLPPPVAPTTTTTAPPDG
jgi:cell division protein FtsB